MKEKKSLASTITFGALPSASAISGTDIFPGTQSGSDVKYTFNQVITFLGGSPTFQSVYNNSVPNPSFQVGINGFSITDPLSNFLMYISTNDNSHFSLKFGSQTVTTLSNIINGGLTQFYGNSVVNYLPSDVGVSNSNFTFSAQSNIPSTTAVTAGSFQYGFSDETSSPSGFYKLNITDTGNSNNIFYALGTTSGAIPKVGINGQLTLGIPYASLSNQHAQLQLNTTTQGFLPPVLTSTQESTLISLLSSVDSGLFWYNSTIGVPTYWDGLDRQQILAIDNIIQGTNMNIVNNEDGTVTFSSSGSSGSTQQVNGAFTVYQNTTSTTPSTSTFNAVAIDATKFTAVNQNGTSVTTATIDSVTTPIIINTSAGGPRYCNVTFDISINPSFIDGQLYTFAIIIKRNGGGLVVTNFQTTFGQPLASGTGGFKPISISGLVGLGTNDYVYLSALCNNPSEPFVAYNFNAELTDTTVASIPSTDALTQGSSNLYLSQNGGLTYQNVITPVTVGHIASFSTVGGKIQDSGTSVSQIVANQLSYSVVTGTTQQIAMNTVYFVKGGSTVTFTLPATSSIAGRIEIIGTGTANWVIVPFSVGQSMEFNGLTATTSVQSGTPNDNLRILYPGDGSGEFNLEFSNGMQITLT